MSVLDYGQGNLIDKNFIKSQIWVGGCRRYDKSTVCFSYTKLCGPLGFNRNWLLNKFSCNETRSCPIILYLAKLYNLHSFVHALQLLPVTNFSNSIQTPNKLDINLPKGSFYIGSKAMTWCLGMQVYDAVRMFTYIIFQR